MIIVSFILACIIGWLAGALVNYLSDILPVRRRLSVPLCLNCGDKFAIINYLFWPRRCHNCEASRSPRASLVEFLFVILSVYLWYVPPESLGYPLGMILLIYFGVVTVIDIEHRLILHPVSMFGAVFGLALGVHLHGIRETLLGGIAGFGIMFALYYLGILFVRFMSHKRGIEITEVALGFGDVNLSGVIGLILGWPGIIAGLIFAILIGGFISLLYLLIKVLRKQYRSDLALPYGPFLVASAVFLLYFGDLVIR
jgi:leader peptidase (prepilin peptidase)/N-methyltransferase